MAGVRIEPWSEGDLDLLRRLNAPEIRAHTGGQRVYELGWAILPGHQGRGLATAAVRAAVAVVRARRTHRFAHAYPSVDNAPSNAVCRKAGSRCSARPSSGSRPGT